MTHRCEDHGRISEIMAVAKAEVEHLRAQDAATSVKLDQFDGRLRRLEIRVYLIVGGFSLLPWVLKLIAFIPAARAAIGGQ